MEHPQNPTPSPSDLVSRVVATLCVSLDDVARWIGGSGQEVGCGAGPSPLPEPVIDRLTSLARLAETFAEVLEADAIVVVFAQRSVPLLGGLTHRAALDAQWSIDVLIDIARRSAGRQPETEAGARYFAGPAAAASLAR